MTFFNMLDEKVKKMGWVDVAFTKFAVMAFTLMIVNFIPSLLDVSWKLYAAIFVLFAAKPFYSFLFKK